MVPKFLNHIKMLRPKQIQEFTDANLPSFLRRQGITVAVVSVSDLNLFCDETTLDLRRSQRHMPGMTLHVYENLWLWIRSLKETWNLQIASLKIASDF